MKRFIAFMCALVLVCSIAAVTLAECAHGGKVLIYRATVRNYTKPRWVQCANNPYMHAHSLHYREIAYVYYCRICDRSYTKYESEYIGETCPCVH